MKKHYLDLKDMPFYAGLCKYMSSGPVLAMVTHTLPYIDIYNTIIDTQSDSQLISSAPVRYLSLSISSAVSTPSCFQGLSLFMEQCDTVLGCV